MYLFEHVILFIFFTFIIIKQSQHFLLYTKYQIGKELGKYFNFKLICNKNLFYIIIYLFRELKLVNKNVCAIEANTFFLL